MIDIGLFIIMVILGVASFLLGYVFGVLFHKNGSLYDDVEPCETIEDIIKREG